MRTNTPGLERQAHQQLRGLAARHRHEPAVASDLDGTEHRDLEHARESKAPASARCQRSVSASLDDGPMPATHPEQLIHQLVVGDAAAIAAIVEASRTSDDPMILVAAALFAPDGDGLMARAGGVAATTRDRQLVAIATAHLRGERDLVDALARDHLVDHPDNVLVAWIAGASHRSTTCTTRPRTRSRHEPQAHRIPADPRGRPGQRGLHRARLASSTTPTCSTSRRARCSPRSATTRTR